MFHKILEISFEDDGILIAEFENGVRKKYCVKNLYNKFEIFKELDNESIFKMAKVDAGGLGISWNDDIDLSSEEIWENGLEVK